MAKVFVTTVPFGTVSRDPLDLLEAAGLEYQINPLGKKMTDEDFGAFIEDVDYIVAGLPNWTPEILDKAKKLKLIARVGIGLDNVPFEETKKRGITVSYTPDAPTRAVAELTIGYIIDGLRRFSFVDRKMREGGWNKHMGWLLQGKTIGLFGTGRIGKMVVEFLQPFGVTILAHDIVEQENLVAEYGIRYVSKEALLKESDVVSLHIPLKPETRDYIAAKELAMMKPSAVLINTARGGMVNEVDLDQALSAGTIAGAVLDVYSQEPYVGPLTKHDNVLLSAHIGAGTKESRRLMEVTAVEEVIRFHKGEALQYEIDHN